MIDSELYNELMEELEQDYKQEVEHIRKVAKEKLGKQFSAKRAVELWNFYSEEYKNATWYDTSLINDDGVAFCLERVLKAERYR